ncbi:MAG: hypothetical protein LC623_08815 [Halobacteriales archaeon]|nr:hypothetical protein [Halobacteriales archaeon]
MAVNRIEKGRRLEAQAVELLRSHGYDVHRCIRTPYQTPRGWKSHANDIFGCVDLIAKRAGERTRWIQVTSSRSIGTRRTAFACIEWNPLHDSVELWQWHKAGRKEPRAFFQVLFMDLDFKADPDHRIIVKRERGGRAPEASVPHAAPPE